MFLQEPTLNADRAALVMPFYLKGVAKIWYDSLSNRLTTYFFFLVIPGQLRGLFLVKVEKYNRDIS